MRASFPKLMGEIQAQVVAADINDDGTLEIVSADVRGNVAAWTRDGKEIWTVHLRSLIAQVLLSVMTASQLHSHPVLDSTTPK